MEHILIQFLVSFASAVAGFALGIVYKSQAVAAAKKLEDAAKAELPKLEAEVKAEAKKII